MIVVIGSTAKISRIDYYETNGTQDKYEKIAKKAQDQKQDQEGGYIVAIGKFVRVGMRVFHGNESSKYWYGRLVL